MCDIWVKKVFYNVEGPVGITKINHQNPFYFINPDNPPGIRSINFVLHSSASIACTYVTGSCCHSDQLFEGKLFPDQAEATGVSKSSGKQSVAFEGQLLPLLEWAQAVVIENNYGFA